MNRDKIWADTTIIYPSESFVLGAFCPLGRFVSGTFNVLGLYVLGRFVSGRFVLERFVSAPSSTLTVSANRQLI